MLLENPTDYASALASLFRAAGLKSEIEVSPRGLIVYASSRLDVVKIARGIQRAALAKDPRASVSAPEKDDEEPEATRWWAEVSFDWMAF